MHAARAGDRQEVANQAEFLCPRFEPFDAFEHGNAADFWVREAVCNGFVQGHDVAGCLVHGFVRFEHLGDALCMALMPAKGFVGHVGRGPPVHETGLDRGQLDGLEAFAQRLAPPGSIEHAGALSGDRRTAWRFDAVAVSDLA